jgi:lipid A ethanolaminephosphotransferase
MTERAAVQAEPGRAEARMKDFFARVRAFRPSLSGEALALLTSLFFCLFCNLAFWRIVLDGRELVSAATWLLAVDIGLFIVAVHFALVALLLNRWTGKPLIALLILASSVAVYHIETFGIVFDVSMAQNVLNTDFKEAQELFTSSLLLNVALLSVPPLFLLWRVRLKTRPWKHALAIRSTAILAALAIATGAVLLQYQTLSALVRNRGEIRFLITPGAVLANFIGAIGAETAAANAPRIQIGLDAKLMPPPGASKPSLVVLVVGETARAANWGLNGYARQTTPELAALDVINFPKVTSCGTSTETSLPCMFSPFGRHDYDTQKILGHESLLHLLDHAGVSVLWRDNQSGCKDVCSGLPTDQLDESAHPLLCDGERCLDEILLDGLVEKIRSTPGPMLVVLHQLGNHGPAYYRRYPDKFRRFTPACETEDLSRCTKEEIVNAYDNALLYTDHFLARAVALLQADTSHASVLLYISDHGESLGEGGLFLHGMPYFLAPKEQTEVPMVLWFSQGYASSSGIDIGCMRQGASEPTSHDTLFHSVLGLLNVKTSLYDPLLDLTASCRDQHPQS